MPATVSQLKRTAKMLFRWCVVDGALDEGRARVVVQQVLQSRHRGYFTVLSEFQRLIKLQQARQTARIDSAVPLEIDLQARIRESVERVYGQVLNTEFVESPELIGGIRIQVSNDVYDGSVKSRLAALAASFGIRSA
jgi:F-type H+-transporting ATPase subunit delta